MTITNLIGYLAAAIGTFLMVPQVLKTISTKRVDDISNGMLAAYLAQCALWDVYGILLHAYPLIVCNTVAFCIGTFQVWLKIKYGKAAKGI